MLNDDTFQMQLIWQTPSARMQTPVPVRRASRVALTVPSRTLPSTTTMALPPQLLHTIESLKFQAKDAFWALSSCICQQSAKIKINGRTCQS